MIAANEQGFDDVRNFEKDLPRNARDHVLALIDRFAGEGTGAEIGTFNGNFAHQILSKTSTKRLYCVDPYKSYDEFHDAINNLDLDVTFANAQARLREFGDRTSFIRKLSSDAAYDVPDASLDFVYIDGNHQCAFVLADLKAWWPKVKKGGIVIGDDCFDMDDSKRNEAGDIVIVHKRKADGTPEAFGEYGVYHAIRLFSAYHELKFKVIQGQFVLPNW